MKTIRLILMMLAVGLAMAARVLAQDQSAAHQSGFTNANSQISFSLNASTEPAILLGTNLPATGLLVDFIRPVQTWELLNPLTPPAPAAAKPAVTVPPAASPHPDRMSDDLAGHDANFVLLRLSFP